MLGLGAGDGGRRHPGAEFLGGRDREPAPAATDLQEPLTGADSDLLRQGTVFGALGGLQVFGAVGEQGGGGGHGRVEPSGEKLVAQVVVRVDVALAAAASIRPQKMLDAPNHAVPYPAPIAVAPGALVAAQHRQQPGKVRRIPVALDVAFGESDTATGQVAASDAAVVQPEYRVRPRFQALEGSSRPVRKLQLQAALMQVGSEP